ncbi:MAG: hypothetical protein JHD38_01720 [Mycolicibacterium sp.]|nr:hypothetical protein [Mycolicibacterium sp.]
MGRRRPDRRADRPVPQWLSARRVESGPDGYDYEVKTVSAARATKAYRCPGCDHEIATGVAHVVALPVEYGDIADRRHWHTACWNNRATRGPTRRWS